MSLPPSLYTWVRCLNDHPLSLAQWGCRSTHKGHSSPVRLLWWGGHWGWRWIPQCLLPQGYKHTASLWLGPASWLCFGPFLPLPDHHSLQDAVVETHPTHSLLQCWFLWFLWSLPWKRKIYHPFWVTQLLYKCSCPWFVWFVSCSSPTASPLLCSK